MTYTLRKYQQAAVKAGLTALASNRNGILVLPTGSGKSLVIASIIDQSKGKTIVLQPSKEILEQNQDKIESYGYDVGVYSASCGQKDIKKITLATIGSVFRHKELFSSFSKVIVDECHLINSRGGMYEEFLNHLKLPTIGLTATPYRMKYYSDYTTMQQIVEARILTRTRPRIFKDILHITQIETLLKGGYLCQMKYTWRNKYDSALIKSNSTGMGFDDKALQIYNQRFNIIDKVAYTISILKSKHILIFSTFCSESELIKGKLHELGISCEEVSAKTPKQEREDIIAAFRAGKIRCIVNVNCLSIGFDFPKLDCIILARPTKSVLLYYQMIGRGIRPAPNKPFCRLIDLCDNVRRFGKIRTFWLEDPSGSGLWRLRSNKGYLTGVNIINREDLEAKAKDKRMSFGIDIQPNIEDTVLTFGKFKGQPLSNLDDWYINWGAQNCFDSNWKDLFLQEKNRREL